MLFPPFCIKHASTCTYKVWEANLTSTKFVTSVYKSSPLRCPIGPDLIRSHVHVICFYCHLFHCLLRGAGIDWLYAFVLLDVPVILLNMYIYSDMYLYWSMSICIYGLFDWHKLKWRDEAWNLCLLCIVHNAKCPMCTNENTHQAMCIIFKGQRLRNMGTCNYVHCLAYIFTHYTQYITESAWQTMDFRPKFP